jgi:hypothetical protein
MVAAESAWTSDELSKIGEADELEIASPRADGTLRRRGRSGLSKSCDAFL